VIDFLQGVFGTRSQAEWVEWFRGRDVCFAPVKNLREAFDDPQVQAREMRLVDELGQEHIGLPIRFTAEPGRADFTLPRLGEHTEQVLRAVGYADEELATLRAAGAF
jgi:crotonobetainyl-CoA:carnitine CoA-transferase CaiB-like acyl-CoA transferase